MILMFKIFDMKKLILLLFLLTGTASFAQQDPLFTQYMYDKLHLDPGYAGSQDLFSWTCSPGSSGWEYQELREQFPLRHIPP